MGLVRKLFASLYGMTKDLLRNLWFGLHAVFGRGLRAGVWFPRVSSYLGIWALCLACVVYVQRSGLTGPIHFSAYGVVAVGGLLCVALLVAILVCAVQRAYQRLPVLLTASASLLLGYLLVHALTMHYIQPWLFLDDTGLRWLFPFYAVTLSLAAVKTSFTRPLLRSYLLAGGGVLLITFLVNSWFFSTQIFYAPSPQYQQYEEVDTEAVYYRQNDLVEKKLSLLAKGDPQRTELFFLGFAGNGDEAIFRSEARYAQQVIAQKYSSQHHAMHLASNLNALEEEPLANVYNLEALLHGIAHKMDSADDVLMLFLTSHGSRDGSIDVSQWPFEMQKLEATQLSQMLDDAGVQWRVIIVSACFSGTFIESLRNANTLIVTAASAQRTSFGCSSDRDLTYFGEALFGDALGEESDFVKAVEMARQIVSKREREEDLEPSQPQLIVGSGILKKLAVLGLTTE